ncbi:MAG TPA: hypothetical protein VJV79_33115 [Polyangiaceae bacterium]|nr:hypothetical protein [Polyangiaceae bacterium]
MRVRLFSSWGLFSLVLATPAFAGSQPPAVWYRASEACPGGAQFLEKLAESSRKARLAQAGDHIDFVVTLVASGGETVGRLERQTNAGIVAIRELRDATCERVADALALSLSLALGPEPSPAEPGAEKTSIIPEAVVAVAPSSTLESSLPSTPTPASTTPLPVPPAPNEHAPAATVPQQLTPALERRWSVGLDAGLMIGISTRPLPRAEAFVDFRPASVHLLPRLSLRAGVVGAAGSSATPIGPVRRWILAGRAEACPVAWSMGSFELRPCLAFELGATGASSEGEAGLDDRSIWAAPGAQLRLAFALQPKWVWLEASGGAIVPLTRNEIFSGAQSLYRDAPLVFHGNFGLSVRLP